MRKNRASAPEGSAIVVSRAVTVLSRWRACKKTRPRFLVLDLSVLLIETLRPVVARIRQHDRALGEQIRTALNSVALKIGEGNRSQGGHRIARFSTAAGSNGEVRIALRVAVAWGYVPAPDIAAGEALLDRIAGMLHRLGARR